MGSDRRHDTATVIIIIIIIIFWKNNSRLPRQEISNPYTLTDFINQSVVPEAHLKRRLQPGLLMAPATSASNGTWETVPATRDGVWKRCLQWRRQIALEISPFGACNQHIEPENGTFNGAGNGAWKQRLQWRWQWRLKSARWRRKSRLNWCVFQAFNGAGNGALDWRLKNGEMTPFNGAWTGQLLRLKSANNGARFIVPMEAEASYLDQVQQENSRGLYGLHIVPWTHHWTSKMANKLTPNQRLSPALIRSFV